MRKSLLTLFLSLAFVGFASAQLSTISTSESMRTVSVPKINAAIAQVNTNTTDIGSIESAIANLSAFEAQLGGVNLIVSTEIDTLGEIETLLGGVNLMDEDEVDAKLAAVNGVNAEQDAASLTADNSATGTVYTGENAGETIAQWLAVYFDTTAGEMMLCEPTSFAEMDFEGLAYAASTDGNPISLVADGYVRNDAWNWSAKGVDIYVVAGGVLTETKPTAAGHFYARIARSSGRATFADEIKFYKTVVVFEVPTP